MSRTSYWRPSILFFIGLDGSGRGLLVSALRTIFMEKAKIREHLAEAERRVKKGEKLIEEQERRVEEMTRDGHPTEIHEETLKTFRDVEKTMKKNRDAVREELEENQEK